MREETPNGNRGTCPVTKRSGVKLVYEAEIDGKKVMVSKAGKATLANAKKRAEANQKSQARKAEEKAKRQEPAPKAEEPKADEEAPEPVAVAASDASDEGNSEE